MKASQGVWAALASALALCAQAREPDVSGLRAYSLPTYTLITHDRRAAGWAVSQSAMIEGVLGKLLKQAAHATGIPTFVYLVRNDVWKNYLQPGDALAAEFVPTRFANYLLLGCPLDEFSVERAISHEYAHYFLHTQFRGYFPLWFDEGMAELMEHTQMKRGEATVFPLYLGAAASRRIPMARLLRIDKSSSEYLNEPTSSGVHEQSWAMVHKGLLSDSRFGGQLFEYLTEIRDQRPIDEAVVQSFHMSVSELDNEITRYLHQPSFAQGEIRLASYAAIDPGAGRPLPEFEALELIADVMLDADLHSREVAEVIDAVDKRTPNGANVQVLRIRLAARSRDDAVLLRLWQNFAPESADARSARGVGLALFERVHEKRSGDSLSDSQRDAWISSAYPLLDRSLAENPDDAEAAWAFGVLSARLKRNTELALHRLQRASDLVPGNSDLSMAKALLCEANGQLQPMLANLNDMAQFAKSVEQRSWAMERIVAVQGAHSPIHN